jgi:tRNA1Val (adenine37-N6)-methyltransferase
MMAQVSEALVDAIDIDQPSILEAAANFASSPWPDRLSAIHTSLQEFAPTAPGRYDFIVSNPPYFTNDLKSPSARKNRARHAVDLTLPELARYSALLLTESGTLCVVIPSCLAAPFETACRDYGLHPSRTLEVATRCGRTPTRRLTAFTRQEIAQPHREFLTIADLHGRYTPEYLNLTAGFHTL